MEFLGMSDAERVGGNGDAGTGGRERGPAGLGCCCLYYVELEPRPLAVNYQKFYSRGGTGSRRNDSVIH